MDRDVYHGARTDGVCNHKSIRGEITQQCNLCVLRLTWSKILGKVVRRLIKCYSVCFLTSFMLPLMCSSVPLEAACLPSLVWQDTYNAASNLFDHARAVKIDSDGSIVVVGYFIGTGSDWLIRKYNSGGTLLWERTYIGPSRNEPYDLAIDLEGNIVVAGVESGGGGDNWSIRKYDSAGNLVWSRSYNSPADFNDEAFGVAVDGNGNVVAVGYEYRTDLPPQGEDWLVRKYDGQGTLLWSRTYHRGSEKAWGVAIDSNGSIVVVGGEFVSGVEGENWLIHKYDSAGNLLWSRTHNGAVGGSDRAYSVAIDGDRNILVAGFERSGLSRDWLIRKYTPDGNLLWSRTHDSPVQDHDEATDIAVDQVGNAIVVGIEDWTDVGQSWNWLIQKYDPGGNLLWSRTHNAVANSIDWCNGVAIGMDGDFVAVGVELRNDLGENFNWLIQKYHELARITARLVVDPPNVKVGDMVDVSLSISNTGGSAAMGISASLSLSDASLARVVTGFNPSIPTDVGLGNVGVISWRLESLSEGQLLISVSATATGVCPADWGSLQQQGLIQILTRCPEVLPYPNPFSPQRAVRGVIKFTGLSPGDEMRIYEVSGLLVWEGKVPPSGVLEWDGRNSRGGRQVAPGVYLWVHKAGDCATTRGQLVLE